MEVKITKDQVTRPKQAMNINKQGAYITLDVLDNNMKYILPTMTFEELQELQNEICTFLNNESYDTVDKEIINIIADVFSCNPKNINMETNIFDDLNADSLDATYLILQIENAFKIHVKDEEVLYKAEYEKVGNIARYVKEQIVEQNINKKL